MSRKREEGYECDNVYYWPGAFLQECEDAPNNTCFARALVNIVTRKKKEKTFIVLIDDFPSLKLTLS
jgi:hypothetical protein